MAEISKGEFEFPELPQEQMESAEKSPEIREVAESIEKATLKPEEVVETERDIKASEDLEAAFTAAMDAAPALTVTDEPLEVTLNTTSTYTGIEMQKNDTTIAGDQYQNDAGEPQAASAEGAITIEPAADMSPPADNTRAAEGINTVDQDDTSQAMGIIMEDKPAEDKAEGTMSPPDDNTQAAEGINTVNQDDSSQAMGIIMEDMPAEVAAAEAADDGGARTEAQEASIDTNDGTSTVGIIDTNDGVSAEAIIDTNDMNVVKGGENLTAAEPPTWSGQMDQGGAQETGLHAPDGMVSPDSPDLQMPDGVANPDQIGLQMPDSMEDPDQIGLQIPDGIPGTEGIEGQIPSPQPSPGGMEVGSVEEVEQDGGPKTEDREALIDDNIEASEALIDDNAEVISKIMDQLPESAESFTEKAAVEIVQSIVEDSSADYVSQTSDSIQENYKDLSQDQSAGLLAVSLLKASWILESTVDGGVEDIANGGDNGVGELPAQDSVQSSDEGQENNENGLGNDAQLANIDLQNMLQKQQQTIQMLSNISKILQDTANAVIRKTG